MRNARVLWLFFTKRSLFLETRSFANFSLFSLPKQTILYAPCKCKRDFATRQRPVNTLMNLAWLELVCRRFDLASSHGWEEMLSERTETARAIMTGQFISTYGHECRLAKDACIDFDFDRRKLERMRSKLWRKRIDRERKREKRRWDIGKIRKKWDCKTEDRRKRREQEYPTSNRVLRNENCVVVANRWFGAHTPARSLCVIFGRNHRSKL